MADDRGRRRPRVAGHRRPGANPPPERVEPPATPVTPVTPTTPATPETDASAPGTTAPSSSPVDPSSTAPPATDPSTPEGGATGTAGADLAARAPATTRPADPIEALRPAAPDRTPVGPPSAEPGGSDEFDEFDEFDQSETAAPPARGAATSGPETTSLSSPPFDGELWPDPAPLPTTTHPAGPAPSGVAPAETDLAPAETAPGLPETSPGAAEPVENAPTEPPPVETAAPEDGERGIKAEAGSGAAHRGRRGRRRRRDRREAGADVLSTAGTAGTAGSRSSSHAATVEPRRRRRLAWSVVAILLVAVVALAAVDLVRFSRSRAVVPDNSQATRAAVSAALNAAAPLTSYDYRTTTAAKVARAKPLLTATCAASYQKDLGLLSSTLNPLKSVETVTVMSGGVSSTAKNEVVVLVFGERTSSDARLTTPRVEGLQISLTMVRQQGRWLVSAVINAGSGGSDATTC